MNKPHKRINDYGYFDQQDSCFVLTQEPPKKWLNVHYNGVGEHYTQRFPVNKTLGLRRT